MTEDDLRAIFDADRPAPWYPPPGQFEALQTEAKRRTRFTRTGTVLIAAAAAVVVAIGVGLISGSLSGGANQAAGEGRAQACSESSLATVYDDGTLAGAGIITVTNNGQVPCWVADDQLLGSVRAEIAAAVEDVALEMSTGGNELVVLEPGAPARTSVNVVGTQVTWDGWHEVTTDAP